MFNYYFHWDFMFSILCNQHFGKDFLRHLFMRAPGPRRVVIPKKFKVI
jgi:hypothetical protein